MESALPMPILVGIPGPFVQTLETRLVDQSRVYRRLLDESKWIGMGGGWGR